MSSVSGESFEDAPAAAVAGAAEGREAMLLGKARAGDRVAYGHLVVAYQDRLYNGILRIVGDRDEALDVTQEAFTRGLEKIGTFRGEASAYTWLFRIGMNLAITRLRTVKRQRTFSLDDSSNNRRAGGRRGGAGEDHQAARLVNRLEDSSDESPPDRLERKERGQAVLAALGRLDPELRAVLVMRDVEDFDYKQMAEVLDLPLGTLKSRLFRARLALRDQMRTYGQ